MSDEHRPGTERDRKARPANRLIHETSPYLQQHAHNPVDWYPWGEEAIERARRENRPIFLSVGYSSCHWCHVMERESFENDEIARRMNENFISVKVDREERPDVDQIYMTAVQMLTGSGGWPMSVFLTPDLKPFYAGTYFPPDDRYGRPGFARVLDAVSIAFRERPDDVARGAEEVAQQLKRYAEMDRPPGVPSRELLEHGARAILERFDPDLGGLKGAPKFPHATALRLLLRLFASIQGTREGIEALRAVRVTLDRMAWGGIHDQIGGGFHRYATDERWMVPHFEKMLYDNALLAVAYLEAFQVTGDEAYARVARGTLDFLLRDLRAPEGGFYAALDADSEGEEGTYYLWTLPQLREALGGDEERAALVARIFDVDTIGNFEGRSILHRRKSDAEVAAILGVSEEEARRAIEGDCLILREARDARVRPFRDEKILTDWNALAISAFARGARVLGAPGVLGAASVLGAAGSAVAARYLDAATEAAIFLTRRMRDPAGGLLHSFKDGRASVPAFLSDHANLLAALVDLYEATGEARWIEEARRLREAMLREFGAGGSEGESAGAGMGAGTAEGGALYETRAGAPDLIARPRRGEDEATPSGNGVAAYGLIRLARILGEPEAERPAEAILRAFAGTMEAAPIATAQLLLALDLHLSAPREIAIVGPRAATATEALRAVVDRAFLPHAVLLQGEGDREAPPLEGLRDKPMHGGKPAAYVCTSFTCRAPVTTPEELAAALRE